jgi:hypothetical protein
VLDFTSRNIWGCEGKGDSKTSEQSSSSPSRGIPGVSDNGAEKRGLERIYPQSDANQDRQDGSQSHGCRVSSEGTAFRRRVWESVETELGEAIKTAYIVPDAVLATVPFAALPGSGPRTFLLDERMIV